MRSSVPRTPAVYKIQLLDMLGPDSGVKRRGFKPPFTHFFQLQTPLEHIPLLGLYWVRKCCGEKV